MAGLQVLEVEFSAQGYHTLGFFNNDFGNQGGTPAEIDACIKSYAVSFSTFELGKVTPPAQPVFDWILSQPEPGPASGITPTWNFDKYLISKTGQLVKHWRNTVDPPAPKASDPTKFDSNPIVVAIREELAK